MKHALKKLAQGELIWDWTKGFIRDGHKDDALEKRRQDDLFRATHKEYWNQTFTVGYEVIPVWFRDP